MKGLLLSKTTILIIGLLLIIILGYVFYRMYERAAQRSRVEYALTQRKTVEEEDKSLGRAIRNFVEENKLETFFKVEKLKDTLAKTDPSSTLTLDTLLLTKVAMPVLVAIIIYNFGLVDIVIDSKHPNFKLISMLVSLTFGAACFPLPDILVGIDAKRRANEFLMSFPAVIDLLLICIQSGISFEHSLQRISRDASVLSQTTGEELTRILRDIHLLGSREQALINFKARIPNPAVEDFVLVILQSERYGTSMAEALRVLSDTVRAQQMMMLERKVLKMPTIISFLVMIFMMPAVLVMIFAPIMLGGLF